METIRKGLFMISATCISAMAFSQVAVGVHSTTNAAVRSSVGTSVVKQTVHSAANATKATASVAGRKTVNTTTRTTAEAGAKSKKMTRAAAEAKEHANANAGLSVGVQTGTGGEANTNNASGHADAQGKTEASTHAGVILDGEKTIDNAGDDARSAETGAATKTKEGLKKANAKKAKVKAASKARVKAAKEKAGKQHPAVNAHGEVNADTNSSTSVNHQ